MKKMILNVVILTIALGLGACNKNNSGTATESSTGDTVKPSRFQTINYLNSISGKKTIAGKRSIRPWTHS